jgi:hypothetical protein
VKLALLFRGSVDGELSSGGRSTAKLRAAAEPMVK